MTEVEISRLWLEVTGTYEGDCPWDIHGFARAIESRSLPVNEAVAEAYERAAKVCDGISRKQLSADAIARSKSSKKCAAAIRALIGKGE